MQVFYNPDKEVLLSKAGEIINTCFSSKKPTLFLSSGGSALKILPLINPVFLGSHITIGVVDERFSNDPEVNNFAQIRSFPFYPLAINKKCKVIDTYPLPNESQAHLTVRFNHELQQWRQNNPQGNILVTLGMGPDGHISGIFPFPDDPQTFQQLFEINKDWVIGYDVGEKNPYPKRVTTTPFFLKEQIDVAVSYIVGADKKEPFRKAMSKKTKLYDIPASIMQQMKKVYIFTDISLT